MNFFGFSKIFKHSIKIEEKFEKNAKYMSAMSLNANLYIHTPYLSFKHSIKKFKKSLSYKIILNNFS